MSQKERGLLAPFALLWAQMIDGLQRDIWLNFNHFGQKDLAEVQGWEVAESLQKQEPSEQNLLLGNVDYKIELVLENGLRHSLLLLGASLPCLGVSWEACPFSQKNQIPRFFHSQIPQY